MMNISQERIPEGKHLLFESNLPVEKTKARFYSESKARL